MEIILAALIAGATAAAKDTATAAVKDAYEGLKTLLKKKFEKDAVAKAMIDAEPEDLKETEDLLKNKITKAGIDKDEEIVKKAEEIMKQEDPEGFEAGRYNTTVNVQGDVIGVAGTNTGTLNFGNITR